MSITILEQKYEEARQTLLDVFRKDLQDQIDNHERLCRNGFYDLLSDARNLMEIGIRLGQVRLIEFSRRTIEQWSERPVRLYLAGGGDEASRLYKAAKLLHIAQTQGMDATLLHKLANG